MIEEIKTFIDSFFAAEAALISASRKPNLEDFNKEVDNVRVFSTEDLKYTFGTVKMDKLRDEDYYERTKNWPSVKKRILFRIEEYKTPSQDTIFLCFVSKPNPSNRKRYFNLLVVNKIASDYKISSSFFLSDRGMGGKLKWFSGGSKTFVKETKDTFLLDVASLGKQISVHRIEEPIGHKESIELHKKDNVFA